MVSHLQDTSRFKKNIMKIIYPALWDYPKEDFEEIRKLMLCRKTHTHKTPGFRWS